MHRFAAGPDSLTSCASRLCLATPQVRPYEIWIPSADLSAALDHVSSSLLGCRDRSELVTEPLKRGDLERLAGVRIVHRRPAAAAEARALPANERACTVVTELESILRGDWIDLGPESAGVRVRGDAVLLRVAGEGGASAGGGGQQKVLPFTFDDYKSQFGIFQFLRPGGDDGTPFDRGIGSVFPKTAEGQRASDMSVLLFWEMIGGRATPEEVFEKLQQSERELTQSWRRGGAAAGGDVRR